MFHDPVPAKNIPDYYKVIRCPMDLGTMTKASHTHTHCQQDLRSVYNHSGTLAMLDQFIAKTLSFFHAFYIN